MEVPAAAVRGTPGVFLRIRVNMLRRTQACIGSQAYHKALPKICPSQNHYLFLQLINFRIDLQR